MPAAKTKPARPKKKTAKKKKPPETPEQAIRRVMIRLLGHKSRGPRFAVELTSGVQVQTKTTRAECEVMLQSFIADGRVILREKMHPDPHLATADLRVVAPIDRELEDSLEQAEAAIERLWAHWVQTWEEKHVCGAVREPA